MLARIFLNHPHSVDESYLEHMGFAVRFGFKLLVAAAAALIHALIPSCCENTASGIIDELQGQLKNRGSQNPGGNR